MKRTYNFILSLLLLAMFSNRSHATPITWIHAGTGNWSVATNWFPSLVPGPGDDVYIYSNTVTLDFNNSINSLTLRGGTLEGASTLAVSNQFTWSGGTLGNTGGITLYGTSTLNGTNYEGMVLGNNSQNALLINAGQLAWSGAGTNLYLYDGTLTNLPSGTITIAADVADAQGAYLSTLGNAGLVVKTNTTGTTTLNAPFVNTGTVHVQSGSINLGGSYSLANGTLDFGISGPTNYGKINLSGAASFKSGLGVNLNGLYWPATNSSFNLLTYTSESGVLFTNAALPPFITWQTNYNATAFTLSVLARQTNAAPTSLVLSRAGNTNLNLAWPGDHTGWQLEAQTNSLQGTNWVIVPGSGLTNQMTLPIGPTNGAVFFRLVL